MDDRFLHYERPASPPSGRHRLLGAIAIMALVSSPVFMLFLSLGLSAMEPAKSAITLTDYFDLLPTMPFYGLLPGVPAAVACAALLSLLARWGWDTIGVSLLAGVVLGAVLEIAFIAVTMPEMAASTSLWGLAWGLFSLLLPFGCSSALLCAIYWRMVIRHQRQARLAAKRAAAAIRAME
jgi:hypothetical protein